MSEPLDAEATEAPVEPERILFPSTLGSIGIELVGGRVTRLVIVPKGRERRLFTPFGKLDRSEELDELLGQLSEWLAGARRKLTLNYDLGPSGVDGFAKRVLKETARIPYGRTRTYQEIAAAAGRPEAYRQVLSILVGNPIPIIIPCHRVVTAKSGPGSYVAGTKKKQRLLNMEKSATQIS